MKLFKITGIEHYFVSIILFTISIGIFWGDGKYLPMITFFTAIFFWALFYFMQNERNNISMRIFEIILYVGILIGIVFALIFAKDSISEIEPGNSILGGMVRFQKFMTVILISVLISSYWILKHFFNFFIKTKLRKKWLRSFFKQ